MKTTTDTDDHRSVRSDVDSLLCSVYLAGSKSTDHETKAKIDISIINWFAWQPEHRRYIAAVSHRSEARPS